MTRLHPLLTERQFRCLRGVAEHLSSEQIAPLLGISPHTVNGHIDAAIKKLGAQTRRDAVRIVFGDQNTAITTSEQWVTRSTAPENDPCSPNEDCGGSAPITLQPAGGHPGESLTGKLLPVEQAFPSGSILHSPDAVREGRQPYNPGFMQGDGRNERAPNHLMLLATMVAIAVGLVILAIAIEPLSRGAANLANRIQPFHRQHE